MTPFPNSTVSLLSWWSGQNIFNGDIACSVWRNECRPSFAMLCQLHVCSLHLFARETLFDTQVQADKGKCDADGLAVFVGMLSRVRINNMLVNKPQRCINIGWFKRLDEG
jgi:hypothetical protein